MSPLMTIAERIADNGIVADPGRQIAQLRLILGLVEQIAGMQPSAPSCSREQSSAKVNAAYAEALPIRRCRFDAMSAEITAWASAGVGALLSAAKDAGDPPGTAAMTLATALAEALDELDRLLMD